MAAVTVDAVIGMPMAFSLGLAYGLGPCLASCLPYLAPVFLSRDFSLRNSWQVVLPLAAGRLTAYCSLGAAAGYFGWAAQVGSGNNINLPLIVGVAAVLMGLSLLWQNREAPPAAPSTQPLRRMPFPAAEAPRTLLPGGLYLMGIGMALSPCAPLGTVLFSAGMSGSPHTGLLLAGAFGLGAIVVPSLVFGLGAAYFGTQLRVQLRQWRRAIERFSAGLLILVGLSHLLR